MKTKDLNSATPVHRQKPEKKKGEGNCVFWEKKYFKKIRKAHTIVQNVFKAFFQIFLANNVWFGLVKSSVAYAFGIQIYILIKVCL